MCNIKHYWENKTQRAEKAIEHTLDMELKYPKEIDEAIKNSIIYTKQVNLTKNPKVAKSYVVLKNAGAGQAIADLDEPGRTAVLNFASYKNPGGGFIDGSKAQEECLCHDSFLYNVLVEMPQYYKSNAKNLNRALYTNRAIYTPNVKFVNKNCDVITCAAPNFTTAKKYQNVSEKENNQVLQDRINFVIDIAIQQEVDNLILGAYGCGVFGQNPTTVCEYFLEALEKKPIKTVIFAIPKGEYDNNYECFERTLKYYR